MREYEKAPNIIPIYGHRYIPYVKGCSDVPVFSIRGCDIIYYGENLISYLEIEFGIKDFDDLDYDKCKHIDFWSDIM